MAINATTVEVTYKEAVKDVNASKYSIEGLTIASAVVKQTDSKTVVLTTSTQEGAKEYTVKSGAIKIGTFKGVSAVIPTAVTVTTPSIQGTVGKEVTVKATVTVPEGQSKAGIPVTVNVPAAPYGGLNGALTAEVYTDANGQATYSYTRYYAADDQVTVYATGDRSKFSTANVYFTKALAVQEITAGNDLTNNTKKSYKVTGKKDSTYYIAIKENINVTPDKITDVKVLDSTTRDYQTPYKTTTGGLKVVTVTTDKDGEGTFTIYGENLSATPIVYLPNNTDGSYSSGDLQAVAPTVKFSLVNALSLNVAAEGVANSAAIKTSSLAYNATSIGGRNYTVTVTDKNGKLAPEGTLAYVAFENMSGSVLFSTGDANFTNVTKTSIKQLKVGKDGKVTFRVAGSGENTFVKPTVFLNTAGDTTTPVLDKTDVQVVAETTYFVDAVVKNAVLTVKNEKGATITSTTAGTDAYVTYQSVDQNGFNYAPTVGAYDLSYDVTSSFGNVIVKNESGSEIKPTQNLGNTYTYKVLSDANGKAVVRVTTTTPDSITVNVTGASGILPTKAATVSFTGAVVLTTLEKINAATSKEAVLKALLDDEAYEAKLAKILNPANQLKLADQILEKRPGSGYTQTQLDTAFTTEYNKYDIIAPAAPSLEGSGSLSDSILNATELTAATAVQVNLAGTTATAPAEGDVVKVTFNGKEYSHTLTSTNITAGNAVISIQAADLTNLANGNHIFTATITDASSNTSSASVGYTITVDKVAPNGPTSLSAPAGLLTISGNTEPNAKVKVYAAASGGVALTGTDVVNANGTFTWTAGTALTANTPYYVEVTDAAGNVSATRTPVTTPAS